MVKKIANYGSTAKDRNYRAWLRAPSSNQIRKSTIVVLSFYQQKKDSKVSIDLGSVDLLKPHQAPLPENRVSTGSLVKVNLVSLPPNISNTALYPIFRDLEDLPPGFGGC